MVPDLSSIDVFFLRLGQKTIFISALSINSLTKRMGLEQHYEAGEGYMRETGLP